MENERYVDRGGRASGKKVEKLAGCRVTSVTKSLRKLLLLTTINVFNKLIQHILAFSLLLQIG